MSVALVVGTRKGAVILTSDKTRRTWTGELVLKGWHVTASARDAGGRIYAAIGNDVYGPAIMASDDLKTWRQLDAAPRYREGEIGNPDHNRTLGAADPFGRFGGNGRYVDQIWTLHATKDALYAGVSEAGLFVSRDRGERWEPVDGFNNHPSRGEWVPGFGGLCAHTILSDAKNPDRLWVGVSAAGFFRTDDGGRTWTRKNDGVSADTGQCVHCLAHDPGEPDTIYRQDHRGVYLSEDGGDHWRPIEDGLHISELSDGHRCAFGFPIVMDRRSRSVFTVPLDGDNFRIPPDGALAVYRTSNRGAHWRKLTDGLPRKNHFAGILRGAMAADQQEPGGIYFGTTSGAVYGTADLGENWSELASGLPRILSVEAYPL